MDFGDILTDVRTIKDYPLKPGTLHFIGDSSSPDLIFIQAVNKDFITYFHYPYTHSQRLERRIASDLIRRGDQSAKSFSYKSKLIGKHTNLSDIQRKRIFVKAPQSEWGNLDKINSSLGYNMLTGEFEIYGTNQTVRELKKHKYKVMRVLDR